MAHVYGIPDYGILHKPGYDLGGKGRLTVNATPTRILQLSADRDGDPYTVAIGVDVKALVDPPATSNHLLRGRLLFGSKGGKGDVTFDLRNGIRLTVEASYVTLSAFMVGTTGSVGETAFEIHSSIGQGTTNGAWSLTFTEPRITLGAGTASSILRIPSYARRVACYANTTGTWQIEVLASAAGGAPVIQTIPCTLGMEPVEIPNGSQFIQIRNTGLAGLVVTPFYSLTI